MTPMVSGKSQEDTAHPARVHRADEEQLVKYAKIIKIQEIWKERLRIFLFPEKRSR